MLYFYRVGRDDVLKKLRVEETNVFKARAVSTDPVARPNQPY
jgi:hypothetical protein